MINSICPKNQHGPKQTGCVTDLIFLKGVRMLDPSFRTIYAKGSFGDGKVPVHILEPESGRDTAPLVIMLHGVHGCASPEMGNKYGDLGRMLFETGAACAMVETSRRRRDRDTFGTDREAWAHAAFGGKTFSQDMEDAIAGTEAACREAGAHNVWVFGFSLGGIHALLAAGEENGFSFNPAGIALGGTGSGIRPEAAGSLALPVLDTAPPEERLNRAAGRITGGRLVSFFGSLDATFSEESCRELFERVAIPPERKNFIVIDGSDHPFRTINGAATTKPIEMITMALSQIIF